MKVILLCDFCLPTTKHCFSTISKKFSPFMRQRLYRSAPYPPKKYVASVYQYLVLLLHFFHRFLCIIVFVFLFFYLLTVVLFLSAVAFLHWRLSYTCGNWWSNKYLRQAGICWKVCERVICRLRCSYIHQIMKLYSS